MIRLTFLIEKVGQIGIMMRKRMVRMTFSNMEMVMTRKVPLVWISSHLIDDKSGI